MSRPGVLQSGCLLVAVTLLHALPPTAAAQDCHAALRDAVAARNPVPEPSAAEDCELGRTRFDQGVAALGAGRAAEGRDRLREALAVCDRLQTRMNYAIALGRAGQPVDALAVWESVRTQPDLTAELRARADEQRARAEDDVAYVVIRLDDDATRASVSLDGVRAGDASGEPICLAANPGEHTVALTSPDHGPQTRQIQVAAGERLTLELSLVSMDADGVDEKPRHWLTAVLIGGILLVAGGIALAVILATQGDDRVVGSFEPLLRF